MDTSPIIDPGRVSALVAGSMGAFLSMLFQRSTSKMTMFTTLASAEIIDYYFSKPIWELLHSNYVFVDDQWQGPVAFSIGLLAIFVVGGVIKMASDFWGSPWNTVVNLIENIVKRFTGRKG